MSSNLSCSVIVPVYNGSKFLERTLPALLSQVDASQLVVVDDGSTDESAFLCRELGVKVISMPRRSGQAAARNEGVHETSGEMLVFVDADVLVPPRAIWALLDRLSRESVSAVFGSYDDSPCEAGFISQYVNLRHHYTHQLAEGEAHTFWAGFGAVRRSAFEEAGGFDPEFTGIEDIALGYRLKAKGRSIQLDPSIQVKHLKRWTFWQMLKADVFYRAVPWSRLKLSVTGKDSLNLKRIEKARAMIAVSLFPGMALVLSGAMSWTILAAQVLMATCANLPISRFFAARRGVGFAIAATCVHQLYYAYASVTFLAVALSQFRR